MYAHYFGLEREPFSIAPDPRFLYMSEQHREALAHLLYGVGGGGGFVLLTGEIGAGKTTVCRRFLEQIPRRCNVAYIFNPKLTVIELLKTVCDEFHIPYPAAAATVKDFVDPLNEYLLRTHAVGQNNVLIIDEAQNLAAEVLEQLRLLTNLETSERKLLQIILIGQPELREMLERPELEQVAQRVIARYHLGPLSEAETGRYIAHRVAVGGVTRTALFEPEAIRRIHQISGGVPRRINLLCDRALLGAYATGESAVSPGIVDRAAEEIFGSARRRVPAVASQRPRRAAPHPAALVGLGVVGALMLMAAATLLWRGDASLRAGLGGWLPARTPAPAGTADHTATAGSRDELAGTPDTRSVFTGMGTPGQPGADGARVGPQGPAVFDSGLTMATRVAVPGAGTTSRAEQAAPRLAGAALEAALRQLPASPREPLRALATRWDLPVRVATDPCEAVRVQQAQCFRHDGGLAVLRPLDRPAVLALQVGDGAHRHALLTGLGHDAALLQLGERPVRVALADLAQVWRGDFITLWRTPPGYRGRLSGADSGPAADWLAARLGVPGDTSTAAREAQVRSRLYAFQLGQGLKPDGLAGPATLMLLSRATGVPEPRLHPLD